MLIVAKAMSYICMCEKNDVLILCKREQTKRINMCKTDAYKYIQAHDIRLLTRHDPSGATRYIKG